ncbi:ATP-binding cassette, subfamily C, CydC [Pilibacter termitis]|uniref:ATP-binding cassette, subfamily C, CydC n=1 Tax=Pilibacter termitis TaxID=263852 RepID=A0A1T4QEU7_9ENTE|nr:thiol reductant ABC exporter subunit CydC [Pilibacter termitis]SKA02330.1 ATP-binding cassette, subfamily C, CydC [Pilibacter termitis]
MKIFHALKGDTWVLPFMKKYKKMLLLAIFLGLCTFLCGGALMFTSGYLISRSASLPENIIVIYVPVVLTRAFGIFRPVFRYIERLTSHNWVLKMTSSLREKLYITLEKQTTLVMNKIKLGDILGILSEDIAHIQNLYLRSIFPVLIAFALSLVVILALGVFSIGFAILIALWLLSVMLLIPFISLLFKGATEEKIRSEKLALYSEITDYVLGVSDIVFSGRGKEFAWKIEEKQENLRALQKKIHQHNRIRNLLLELSFGCLAVVLLIWTTQTFGETSQSANWIAAFVLAVFPLIDAFAPLSEAISESQVHAESIVRMNNLDAPLSQQTNQNELPTSFEIQLQNAHFSYEDKLIFENLNLTVPQGQILALLGKSGAGKSTLLKILRGDEQLSSGEVRIGNQNILTLSEKIDKLIGVIDQSPYLFHTTIRNNLRIANESATDEEIWEVLKKVELFDMVNLLPEKLDTLVDEAGLRFSGGERHRLGLARILLKDTPIVLLDEITNGLDPITERKLLNVLFRELSGRTILWVTHHLLGVEKANRVVFLENKQILMDNTPKNLEKENSLYQELLLLDRGI